jgi:hypothetical protein
MRFHAGFRFKPFPQYTIIGSIQLAHRVIELEVAQSLD